MVHGERRLHVGLEQRGGLEEVQVSALGLEVQVVAPRMWHHVLQQQRLEAAGQRNELHRMLGQLARTLGVLGEQAEGGVGAVEGDAHEQRNELGQVEHLVLGGEAVALGELIGHHVEAVLLGDEAHALDGEVVKLLHIHHVVGAGVGRDRTAGIRSEDALQLAEPRLQQVVHLLFPQREAVYPLER
eukprot:scaffold22955_cov58-Phaeocystis_antarctica.AAC.2